MEAPHEIWLVLEMFEIFDGGLVYNKLRLEPLQWRSQNAEKVTHIKRIQLDQAVILFNNVPFQNGKLS